MTLTDAARIAFDAVPWQSMSDGAKQKVGLRHGKRVRLVELTSDFVEADWCRTAHSGYVVEGTLTFTFDGHVETLAAGDGFVIPGGEPGRHRAATSTSRAILFLVEDA